jgi:hypothetical protein
LTGVIVLGSAAMIIDPVTADVVVPLLPDIVPINAMFRCSLQVNINEAELRRDLIYPMRIIR